MATPSSPNFFPSLFRLSGASRAPYLLPSVGAILALTYICHSNLVASYTRFFFVWIPIVLSLSFLVMVSLFFDANEDVEGVDPYHTFAGAVGISSSILALFYFFIEYNEVSTFKFLLAYVPAIVQLVTFVFFCALLSKEKEWYIKVNVIENCLIISALLLGYTYCILQPEVTSVVISEENIPPQLRREFLYTGIVFGLLWGVSEIVWINRIANAATR